VIGAPTTFPRDVNLVNADRVRDAVDEESLATPGHAQTPGPSCLSATTPMQPSPQPLVPNESEVAAALGRIPSGLFVVAWRDGDADRAMLASWLMQAGFAPPLVSIAIAASRDLLAALDRGATVAVSILGESQRPLLARFGKPSDAPFADLDADRSPGGCAVLRDAAAWLECRAVTQAAHGDHVVVLAEVVSARGSTVDPLVHVRKNGLRY